MSLETLYRFFGEFEARGNSPVYEKLAVRVSSDEDVLALLRPLPPIKQQPNLFFASVNYLGGVSEDYGEFREFVLERSVEVLELIRSRRTQTNEVGRCATILPAVGLIEGPLALVEVGASGGLNLLMDRYAYDYGDAGTLGIGPVVLRCEVRGSCPIPRVLPDVIWRCGLDISPIDVADDEQVRWLEACVFPGRPERLDNLRVAVALARTDPPPVLRGDLLEDLEAVLDDAPKDATTVVFHSAVLNYVAPSKRARFAELLERRGAVWISNEAGGVVETLRWRDRAPPAEVCFFMGRGGTELLAYAHPHGRWIEWAAPVHIT